MAALVLPQYYHMIPSTSKPSDISNPHRNEVEDEIHFLLKCPKFKDLRTKFIEAEYINNPGLNAMISLRINPEKCEKLMKFCLYASKLRARIMDVHEEL